MLNTAIAARFDEIADLLEISDANPFRVRAYRSAALSIRDHGSELATLLEKGQPLPRIPGIGKDLAGKIVDIAYTGTTPLLDELRHSLPEGLLDLLRIPGLGPRRVKALYDQLGIASREALAQACREQRVRALHGFGAKTEQRILETLHEQSKEEKRYLIAEVAEAADRLIAYLDALPAIRRVAAAGSYRRGRETVGDLDILIIAEDAAAAGQHLVSHPEVADVMAHGPTRAAVRLRNGLQVDMRVVAEESYGAALHYFTGSKAHNIAVRLRGVQRGLKINEYGVFRANKRIAGATEESVFSAVGLPYIAPELRENRGEIEAAEKGRLPKLVERTDIRGDLHAHTVATDGRNTLEEMALAAKRNGLSYLAVTEHSKRLAMVGGFDEQRLHAQIDEIDALNARLRGITVLKGIEVDILEDGSLDLNDAVLCKLDIVVASAHGDFGLNRANQTERIIRAINHDYVTVLGHPSGRRLRKRGGYDIDMERIIREAKRRGTFLELNSQPQRLDLNDIHAHMAKSEGVKMSIDSDAHSIQGFANLRFGIGQARRAWLTKDDVLNTRPLGQLRSMVAAIRP